MGGTSQGFQRADAAYVHGWAIDRQYAGKCVGAALRRWAEERTRSAGPSHLRLDCVETNGALRRGYATAGFEEIGRHDSAGPRNAAGLLQKRLL